VKRIIEFGNLIKKIRQLIISKVCSICDILVNDDQNPIHRQIAQKRQLIDTVKYSYYFWASSRDNETI